MDEGHHQKEEHGHEHSHEHKEKDPHKDCGHDHGHGHDHGNDDASPKKEMPSWKKRALESGADAGAAPFGGSWNTESSVNAEESK
jgi:hypothetical protein